MIWKSVNFSFSVTVLDAQMPSISCPANIVRSNDAGQCYATVTYATPTATDNCGTVTVARTGPCANGAGHGGAALAQAPAADPRGELLLGFRAGLQGQHRPRVPGRQHPGGDSPLHGDLDLR